MRFRSILVGAPALLLTGGAAALTAQQSTGTSNQPSHLDLSVAVRAGTPGLGLEVGKLLFSHLAVRVGANYFKLSTTTTRSDITYDASLKLQGVSALVDLFPGGRGSFHFTGGIMSNPLTATGSGVPGPSGFNINGTTYTAGQVGTLTAEVKYPGVGPYAGLGFGTPARGGALEFVFDLGVVIQSAKVALTATGAASNPQLAADVQAEQATLQNDIGKYAKVFPVLSFGLALRF